MTDDRQDMAAARRTGAREKFLIKARSAAHAKVKQADADRRARLAQTHQAADQTARTALAKVPEILSGNLRRLYVRVHDGDAQGRPDRPGRWLHMAPDGTVVSDNLPFGADAAFDEVNQRVYYSAIVQPGPTREFRSADLDGGDVRILGSWRTIGAEEGAIALDPAANTIFWVCGDDGVSPFGVRSRSDIPPGPQAMVLVNMNSGAGTIRSIALDAGHRRLYWTLPWSIMGMNYDRSAMRWIVAGDETVEPHSLTVDSDLGYMSWISLFQVFRAKLDGTDLRRLGFFNPPPQAMAIDAATQMIYIFMDAGDGRGPRLFLARLPSPSGPEAMSLVEKQDFAYDPRYFLAGRSVSRLALVTASELSSGELTAAHVRLHEANSAKPGQVAAAHQQADDMRQTAHADLAAAHVQAAADVATSQTQAATARDQALASAGARQAAAADHVTQANSGSAQRKLDETRQAQVVLAQKQQDAKVILQSAAARLDAARRRLQSS